MPKRSATEAFSGRPVSAFERAKAGRAAAVVEEVAVPVDSTSAVATDGIVDIIESKPPLLERHETFGFGAESLEAPEAVATGPVAASTSTFLSSYGRRALKLHDGTAIVTLKSHEWVSAAGAYDLVLREGAVSIYGAFLTSSDQEHRVYAPVSHALPTIRARQDSVVEFRTVNCALLQLESLSTSWNRIWHKWPNASFAIASPARDEVLALQAGALDIDDATQKAVNRLSSVEERSSQTLVTGAKASGKSTFCRHLSNAVISNTKHASHQTCFWLDLDPGQPEFGSPGQVSLVQVKGLLFGPSFSHPYTHPNLACRTIRAHSLAATSPREDVDHYLECAVELYQHFIQVKKQFSNASLIINCPGWVTGSGVVLLQRLIASLRITDAVILESPEFQNDPITFPVSVKVRTLPSHGRTSTSRPSAESRAMQTMSYFHTISPPLGRQSWTPQPLASLPSLALSYDGSDQLIHAITSYHASVSPSMLADVLEGLPVALVIAENSQAFTFSTTNLTPSSIIRTPESLPFIPPPLNGITPPLNPHHSHSLGQALVRSIDKDKKVMHLVTPVSEAEIHLALAKTKGKGKLVLVRGKFDSPDWAFLEEVYFHEYNIKNNIEEKKGADWDLDQEDDGASRGQGVEGRKYPYVSIRPARNADGEEFKTGEILSERVWRPRHLPRNAR
ncbi:mRNA cleavage and polyadenylation factor CLP1 P-loop-like protein [Elsinoe fawcettii]|nr:mRNA cleavage and polyadenylation factor CLP1 P-loop-like protein [Elsinoe fawcettii]